MLAMRPPPLEYQPPPPPSAAEQQPLAQRATDTTAAAAAAAAAGPLLLLLDVEADAPVVVMPRSTASLDAIEVDLGQLALTSSVQLAPPDSAPAGGGGAPPPLLEAARLAFSGVGLTVVRGGQRGAGVVQNAEGGWRLGWRRPLVPERRGCLPAFDLWLEVPLLRATLSDEEYQQLTSIAAANAAEPIRLPPGAAWLNDHHQRALHAAARGAAAAQAAVDEAALASAAATAVGARSPGGPPELPASPRASGAVPAAEGDGSPTSVRVTVDLGSVELQLLRQLGGAPAPLPLARFSVAGLQAAFRNSEAGSMEVSLCVPRVEALDQRPETPADQQRASGGR